MQPEEGMKTDRIYLAVPYTHPAPEVRQARFEAVTRGAVALMRRGYMVFCPSLLGTLSPRRALFRRILVFGARHASPILVAGQPGLWC